MQMLEVAGRQSKTGLEPQHGGHVSGGISGLETKVCFPCQPIRLDCLTTSGHISAMFVAKLGILSENMIFY